jgi:hypothetical protein
MSKPVEREEIISENDNQAILSTIIDSIDFSQINELHISKTMRGDVDFSILKDKNITNIKAIYIENTGEITSLFNIPDSVKILHCSGHIIKNLGFLPKDIEEIDISHNIINSFDANGLDKLTHLNLANNELKTLSKLPDSLEFLNVENNQLKELNLETTQQLKHLICSNNPILVLQHVPTSLTRIEMENNPFIEIEREGEVRHSKSGKKLDYLQSLHEYFRLKNTYDTNFMNLKKKAFAKGANKKDRKKLVGDVKPVCVNCNRKVGSLFSHKDKYYSAKCGDDKSPCKLDISIYEGDYTRNEDVINMFSKEIEDDKQQIIVDKLNSVFKYINTETYSSDFKEHIDTYMESSDIYKDAIDRYDSIHNNEETKLMIEKKVAEIHGLKQDSEKLFQEYKKTGTRTFLTTFIEMYNRDLVPAIHHLRTLKYAHMYVEIDESEPPVSCLIQHLVSAHSRDYIFGEEPKVMKFVTNSETKLKGFS